MPSAALIVRPRARRTHGSSRPNCPLSSASKSSSWIGAQKNRPAASANRGRRAQMLIGGVAILANAGARYAAPAGTPTGGKLGELRRPRMGKFG